MSYLSFDLTPRTRGAASERRVILQGFEVRARIAVIGGIGLLVGFILALAFWSLLGQYAILLAGLTPVVAIWAFDGRSRKGLHLRNWQAVTDRLRNDVGTFRLNGLPFDPWAGTFNTVHVASVPAARIPENPDQRVIGLVDAGAAAAPKSTIPVAEWGDDLEVERRTRLDRTTESW